MPSCDPFGSDPMNPFATLLLIALIAIAVIVVIALVPSLVIMAVSKKYALQYQAQWEQTLTGQLPGTDCGCCGCESCALFAAALMDGGAEQGQCTQLTEESAKALQESLEQLRVEQLRRQKASDDLKERRKKHKVF